MSHKYSTKNIIFGDNLKQILQDAQVSRQTLAAYLQCSEESIDSWCCGRNKIKPDNLYSLLTFLSAKCGISNDSIRLIHQTALESHGFTALWPPDDFRTDKFTICVIGNSVRRKEIVIAKIISDYLTEKDQNPILFHSGNSISTIASYLQLIRKMNISSLILCATLLPPEIYIQVLDETEDRNIMVCMIATDCPKSVVYSHKNAYSVSWSHHDIAYNATKLLIKAGHTKIGTIHLGTFEERFTGFLDALKDHNLDYNSCYSLHTFLQSINKIKTRVAETIKLSDLKNLILKQDLTAMFIPTELLTIATAIFTQRNQNILRRDFSFCGLAYADTFGEALELPMTYISYPIEDTAYKAIDIIARTLVKKTILPEDRYIDVTQYANRVDKEGGSIRPESCYSHVNNPIVESHS